MSCDTAILSALRDHGALSRGQLAEYLERSEKTIGNAIARLRKSGHIKPGGRTLVKGRSVPVWRASAPTPATVDPRKAVPVPYASGYRW